MLGSSRVYLIISQTKCHIFVRNLAFMFQIFKNDPSLPSVDQIRSLPSDIAPVLTTDPSSSFRARWWGGAPLTKKALLWHKLVITYYS